MSNPFSARCLAPGRLAYLFPARDLERQFWNSARVVREGQILGPHGTGKSTLLCAVARAYRAQGLPVHHWRGTADMPRPRWPWGSVGRGDLVLLDGFDGWPRWQRYLATRRLRRRKCRWIVTSHRDLGLSTLWRTSLTPSVVERVVRQLLGPSAEALPWREVPLQQMLAARGGNLREVLFALYDWFESMADTSVGAIAIPAESRESL